MWQLITPTLQTITVNREDAGQGKVNVSQLFEGDLRLINAIESINWEDEAIQFEIFHCGIVGYQHRLKTYVYAHSFQRSPAC